jgi:hypothetical protein
VKGKLTAVIASISSALREKKRERVLAAGAGGVVPETIVAMPLPP